MSACLQVDGDLKMASKERVEDGRGYKKAIGLARDSCMKTLWEVRTKGTQ